MDFADFTLLLIFSLLSIFCIYKLIRLNRSNKKEIVEENHNIDKINNEKTRLEQEVNNLKDELKETTDNLEKEKNKEPIIIEKEKVKEVESAETRKSIDLLNKKLQLKEDYIKQLENEKEENHSKDVVQNSLKANNFEVTNFDKDNSYEHKLLDLTYTKARKIDGTFVVLDFETTGFKYDEHEIIQYGVVEYKKGVIIKEYTQYFKPDNPVGKTVMRKTGITNEFLEDKPKISYEHLKELNELLEGKTIVAHNAPFDMKFLLKNLFNFNISHEKFRVFDTLTASRRLINETPNHKLETLKEYFELSDGQSHEALDDARATGNLALLLIERSK